MLNAIVFQWRFWTLVPSLSIPRIGLCVVGWHRESVDVWHFSLEIFVEFLFSNSWFLKVVSDFFFLRGFPGFDLWISGTFKAFALAGYGANLVKQVVHGTSSHRANFHGSLWGLLVWCAEPSGLGKHLVACFKLLHNGHEHIWHSHPSSVFSKSSGHDPMVTSQWEIKTDKPQRPAPHSSKIWSSENLLAFNHSIYFLSQCINA